MKTFSKLLECFNIEGSLAMAVSYTIFVSVLLMIIIELIF